MPHKTKQELKDYFQTGDIPKQGEYAELIDALRHVDEKLPIADVESLQASLDSKATSAALINHINDNSLHSASMTGAEIKTAYEGEVNTNAFTDAEKQQVADGVTHIADATVHMTTAEKQQVADGVTHRADTDSHVSTADKTKWDNQLSLHSVGEVLSADMGKVFRIYNGSLYQYIGDFPNANTFTTNDLPSELAENPSRWEITINGFPTPILGTPTPLVVGVDTNVNFSIPAKYMDTTSNLTIGSLALTNTEIDVINDLAQCEIDTTGLPLGDHTITITNLSGASAYAVPFSIATNTVLVPNGSSWDTFGADAADLTFANGEVMPGSFNTSRERYAILKQKIPAGRDASFRFLPTVLAGAGGAGVRVGVRPISSTYDDPRPYDILDYPGAYIYYNGTLVAQNLTGIYGLERENGIWRATQSNGASIRYTYPNTDNSEMEVVVFVPHGMGITQAELTIKV